MAQPPPSAPDPLIARIKLSPVTQHGDLTLVIGKSKHKIAVQSRALISIPFFQTLLFGPFKEGQNSEASNRVIQLPDEDPEAMYFILCILHSNYTSLPSYSELNMDKIFNIALICDKFDVKEQMGPFLRELAPSLNSDYMQQSPAYHKKLFIAWTFGFVQIFKALFFLITQNISLTADRKDEMDGIFLLCQSIFPPGVVDDMCAARIDILESMLQQWGKDMNGLLDKVLRIDLGPNPIGWTASKYTLPEKSDCAARLYGQLSKFLKDHKLRPEIDDANAITKSINSLYVDLKKPAYALCDLPAHSLHVKCLVCENYRGTSSLLKSARKIIDSKLNQAITKHEAYVSKQATRCNLARWVPNMPC